MLGLGMALSACGGPPDLGREPELREVYDPLADETVNPPGLFEAFPHAEPDRAATNDTLILHSLSEPEGLNPLFATNGSSFNLLNFLFDQLVSKDSSLRYFWKLRVDVGSLAWVRL